MTKATDGDFSGKGGRRPMVDIPLHLIDLDEENPRLFKENTTSKQESIARTLYEEYDVSSLAQSMAENGYFDSEPIVVVIPPELLYKFNIDFTKVDAAQKIIESKINDESIRFCVVEGNRRVVTAKLLSNKKFRQSLGIKEGVLPEPKNRGVLEDLEKLPSIIYKSREEVIPYLGVRHITGMLKWDAYAKAAYIAKVVETYVDSGLSLPKSLSKVKEQMADTVDLIKKQYICWKILNIAKDELDFPIDKIRSKFSLLTVMISSPSIRAYIGLEKTEVNSPKEKIIPAKKLENLQQLLSWIFGNQSDSAVLTDSRDITKKLAVVLKNQTAVKYLVSRRDLDGAYERADGEFELVIRRFSRGIDDVRFAIGYADKYGKNKTYADAVAEYRSILSHLEQMQDRLLKG